MGQSRTAWVGVAVFGIALAVGVGALLWSSQSDPSANRPEKGAENPKERGATLRPELANGGDAGAEEAPPADGPLHDRLGGREAIHALTGKLLEVVQKNQILMANEKVRMAAERLNVRELHQRVTNYLCKESGGPCKYTGRPMKDYLVPLGLTSAEWDALEQDFAAVLSDMKVSEQAAEELMAIFAALAADASE